MKAMIVTLFALLALVYAQVPTNTAEPWSAYSTWSADFICTAPQFGTGIFEGKIKYDWPAQAMEISFNGVELYKEFYQFNPERGYNPGSSTGQFTYQYLYKSSKSCPCETTGLNFAMPPLFSSAVDGKTSSIATGLTYYLSGGTVDVSGDLKDSTGKPITTAIKYLANDKFTNTINGNPKSYILTSFFWTNEKGEPVAFNINDFQRRTFILSNVVSATTGTLGLIAPKTGCKCGKQLDIVLSLDRSGSISPDQWTLEFQFVKNLANAFEYGPLATNMGVGNWNAAQWTTISLTAGISATSVQSAVNSMTCCPGTGSGSCCCCGTPIGGGLWLGGNMLSKSVRGKSQKVLILLTDGCQNHLWYPATQKAVSCGCSSEKLCAQNKTCVGDITKWYQWVVDNIPGVRIIVVGVGGADTICSEQLLLAAGGDKLNVYNPQSWSQLQTLVESISATACTADNALCPGCCGICTCGQCIPPTKCFDQNACNLGKLDNTGCCTSEKVICDKKPCKFDYCDDTAGCQWADLKCKVSTDPCKQWTCNNSFVCEETLVKDANGNPPVGCAGVVIPPCNVSLCDDNDTCTRNECNNVTNRCSFPRNDANCQSDKCTVRRCDRILGCIESKINCTDKNDCTTDTCDPLTGCIHTNITCPTSKDPCRVPTCNPQGGCGFVQRDCRAEGFKDGNCTVPDCNNTCYNLFTCAAPPPTSSEGVPDTVVLVATLTTAAIAGIVIAAVLLAAGVVGGGVAAVAAVSGAGGAVVTASNPLYTGTGMGGDNPLSKN